VVDESTAEALAYFDSYVAFQRRHLRVPGIQAAVFVGDRIALSSAHGLADLARGVQLTTSHLFRIASHSKTLTATAVVQLVEAGKLRLDDSAASWIDFLAGTPLADVTVRELLSHASGVTRDGTDGDFWLLDAPFPDRNGLRAILLGPTAAVLPRNERFKYSNVGISLAGLIAEAASGLPYDELLRRQVVDRLGLKNTGADYTPERAGEFSLAYSSLAWSDERAPIDQVGNGAFATANANY
jgi:CubicO group peptidase (beta-lactamase class C family)